ncbi:ATP-binding region ATPase domain protein [Paludibacter propionicigenes WB4]|uniref:ATP-binding region ATPase domain protein n=1 Tax=Paludibacter propionicigenes (strain DSM 17365 / JCM 13257 / WB4) TaxID=694427 RepID=E4T0B5_PALPW|nr:ATP-binding protein [Paludibacter propionicigenes]ADQ78169.1 ATP-binding region ATPase domain protein [Paludibacter propionicigenes WB4]
MGNIKATRYDIGAEVLSILTRGMYPDPKDALREYVQNGVDAGAKSIQIRIRKNTISIDDDGIGMDQTTLRKAARVGVSDKNPGKDVGFMGIGIYSSFHLCEELTIYSKKENNSVCYLVMDFIGMRNLLDDQKLKRANHEINSDELLDLQSLLEKFVVVGETTDDEYPNIGTRIELKGLNTEFINEFSDFKILSNYLREVIPLEFNKINFKHANVIEEKITQICLNHNAKFELVKLFLQVNNESEWLFRPYTDIEFNNNSSYEPVFVELKTKDHFFGVIWGCLNSTRNKISNKDLRGFLVKKQGFAIGDRQKLSQFLRPVYYDRYIGEVIIVDPKILPNAARNDFAYSNLRTILYDQISKGFEKFNLKAHEVQEYTLGDEQIDDATIKLNSINDKFTLYSKDANRLIDSVVEIRAVYKLISDRLERGSIRPERIKDAEKIKSAAKEIECAIEGTIKSLTEQSKKITIKQKQAPQNVSVKLASIGTFQVKKIEFNNLLSLLESLDILLSEDVKSIVSIIDERVVQSLAENEKQYFEILNELKDEFEKLN